jgi:hypothetical protein
MNLRYFGIVSNLQPRGIFVQTECSTCKTDFSCVHNSRFDCKCHTETKVHKDFDKLKTNKKSMLEFCGNPPTIPGRGVLKKGIEIFRTP